MLLWQWYGVPVCHIVEDAARHHNAAHLLGTVQQHTPSPVQVTYLGVGAGAASNCQNPGHPGFSGAGNVAATHAGSWECVAIIVASVRNLCGSAIPYFVQFLLPFHLGYHV